MITEKKEKSLISTGLKKYRPKIEQLAFAFQTIKLLLENEKQVKVVHDLTYPEVLLLNEQGQFFWALE
ncbi:hypothetical protein ACE6H2_009535 [Prunus campanulata]